MDVYRTVTIVLSLVSIIKGNLIVETNSGKVAAIEVSSIIKDEKFYSFYSIPYAEPPVGDNKFMPPKPHPGWDDIISNKKEKPTCAVFNLPAKPLKRYGFTGSEDCLYLSIHTPRLPKDNENLNLPVIIFLQNEYFKIGINASKDYGPDFFMKEDVLLVTIQHRLGLLGFMSYEDDLLPGNNGIRDVMLALQWIQANIHKFGGDPEKVTMMGCEAGAVLVDMLLHIPKAKGLFSAAILQSGTSWHSTYLNRNGKERTLALAKDLEEIITGSSHLVKRFSKIDTSMLVERQDRAVHADEARTYQKGVLSFGPVVEHEHPDAVITEYPEKKPLDIDIPIMIGYNSREGIELSERYLHKPMYLTFADRDFIFLFPYRTDFYFDIQSEIYYNALQEIKDFYFDEGYIKVSVPSEYITYIHDIIVFYPIDYTVRKYVNESKAPVYYYTFDYSGDFNWRKQNNMQNAVTIDGTWGATTGDELCYLFVCKKLKKSYKKAMNDEESEEMNVVRNMVRLWTNFAKTRNPTPDDGEFKWKPATKENKECLVISDELQMKSNLHDKVVKFWDNFIEKYKNLAVDGVIKDDVKDEL